MDSAQDHPKVGFPHSEIFGSTPVRGSPKLIAAYHVLLRLLAPRHPPNALLALDQLLHLSKSRWSRGPLQLSVPCRGHPPSPELLSHPRGRTTRQRNTRRPTPTSTSRLMLPLNDVTEHTHEADHVTPRTSGSSTVIAPLKVVEVNGIEPMTSCLQSRRSPN